VEKVHSVDEMLSRLGGGRNSFGGIWVLMSSRVAKGHQDLEMEAIGGKESRLGAVWRNGGGEKDFFFVSRKCNTGGDLRRGRQRGPWEEGITKHFFEWVRGLVRILGGGETMPSEGATGRCGRRLIRHRARWGGAIIKGRARE